ncbi:MAG: TIGR02996 domain-containing protein [Kofleriaceae bacterium]
MASNAQLEAAILANPDDKSAYSVYADWLQSQGDPRGDLIALSLAGDDAAAGGLMIKKGSALLGPLVDHQRSYDDENTENFTWRWGFIDRARLSFDENMSNKRVDLKQVLSDLLDHPSGHLVRELVFGINGESGDTSLDNLIEVLAAKPRPSLRRLIFGDVKYAGAAREQDQGEETEISWYNVGDLSKLWAQVPNLESVIITCGGDATLGELDLPKLRHFEFRSGSFKKSNLASVIASHTPNLEHLDVWIGQESYGSDIVADDLRPLIHRKDLPKLKHLGIMNCEVIEELIPDLRKSELVAKLDELDLSLGCLSDEGAAAIKEDPGAMGTLAKLDVSYSLLTEAGMLKGVAKQVVEIEQRDPDDRYAAVGE